MRPLLWAAAALFLSGPAQAEWYRASSEHFLIYSEQKPDMIRKFAENLEKFDGAVRAVRGMGDLPLSQGNRITIFSLRSPADVQRLANDKSGFLDGFYEGRAAGSVAFVSRGGESNGRIGEYTILLHEYAHHLMMQDVAVPYPEWLVEGFAEFMSTAQFERDGTVGLGLPATHRYYGLVNLQQLPLETLLSGRYGKITSEEHESIYGRGWLLTHYLTFEPSRKGQLAAYLQALAKGADPLEAARTAFGDIKQLERDLSSYLHRSKLAYLKISGSALNFAPVQVTRLGAGGSAVVPMLVEVSNGVRADAAETLAQKVRAVEALNPGDELVETTLAEVELAANHSEAAEAAAGRALKANPRNPDALVLKGRAIAERAKKADREKSAALFEQARQTFIAANALDKEDPEPLYEFYRTFVDEGVRPNANAIAALHYASDLAPQDLGLRMNSAVAYLNEDKPREARSTLTVVAYSPHVGQMGDVARRMIIAIDGGNAKAALGELRRAPKGASSAQ